MPSLATILQNTPVWVFVLFAILLALGLIGLRTRTVKVWRLLVAPAVFIAWGVYGLLLRLDASAVLPVYWAAALAIASLGAWYGTNLDSMQPDPAQRRVRVEGSVFPLLRNMVLFFAKYAIGISIGFGLSDPMTLYPVDVAVSGVSAGYFIGWLLRFAQRYRKGAIPA
ncbi:MAG: DUF6622 family protein [Ferrovibrio sp.]